MEKFLKRIKVATILIIAVLISVIAFCGLYLQKNGIWTNILPEFNFGMELKGFRELHYKLDDTSEEKEVYVDSEGNYKGDVIEKNTEETNTEIAEPVEVEGKYKKEKRVIKVNEDKDINIENFEKTKKLIQKRLEAMDLYEYNIRQDSVTGELIVELPDDENIVLKQTVISTVGKVTIVDHQTGEILIEDENIKKATVLGTTEDNKYATYLQIDFDEVGAELLKKVSNDYITVTSGDGKQSTNYVDVKLDNQLLITTYFGQELDQGALQIPLGQATESYQEYIETAQNGAKIAEIISGEALPLSYQLTSDNFIESAISQESKIIAEVVFAILIVIVSICMIVKFKFEGFKYAILSIGYIALLLIVIRYTGVIVTLNSLIAFIGVVIINYVFNFKILNKLNKDENPKLALKDSIKELYLAIIPVCIIAIIFTFMSGVVISSIGMTLFWGLIVQALTSLLVLIK